MGAVEPTSLMHELAAAAAQLIVEDGLDYGSAKQRALKVVGAPARAALPGNELVEDHVRGYIALFHGETQPRELAALRRLALLWMERLADFNPHVSGAVWNGTATRRSDIHLQLFCDDSKSAEIALIDQGIPYDVQAAPGFHGRVVDALSLSSHCEELDETIGIHLSIYDRDDIRGALKARGNSDKPRGNRAALMQRMAPEAP